MSSKGKRQEVILHIKEINNLIRKAKTPQNKLYRLNLICEEVQTGKHTSCKQVQRAVLKYINILRDKELRQISIKLENCNQTKHRATENMYEEPLGKMPKRW